jgi:hypothetical protein
MRSAILLSMGVALVVAASNLADDKALKNLADDKAPKAVPQPSKESSVKIRVEVEIRGTLQVDEKGVTVTAQDRVFDWFSPETENPDWTRPAVYTLDFARAKDLSELAKLLNGKEVIITAMGEVRRYAQKLDRRPGGTGGGQGPAVFPTPFWELRRTVLVTGLKSAESK